MSWFQSSLGYVNSAINQAQKSIDKVLDISEDGDISLEDGNKPSGPPSSVTDYDSTYFDAGGDIMLPSMSSTPAKQEASTRTPGKGPSASDTDSFWSSFFDSPMPERTTSPVPEKGTRSTSASKSLATATPKSSAIREKKAAKIQQKSLTSPTKSSSVKASEGKVNQRPLAESKQQSPSKRLTSKPPANSRSEQGVLEVAAEEQGPAVPSNVAHLPEDPGDTMVKVEAELPKVTHEPASQQGGSSVVAQHPFLTESGLDEQLDSHDSVVHDDASHLIENAEDDKRTESETAHVVTISSSTPQLTVEEKDNNQPESGISTNLEAFWSQFDTPERSNPEHSLDLQGISNLLYTPTAHTNNDQTSEQDLKSSEDSQSQVGQPVFMFESEEHSSDTKSPVLQQRSTKPAVSSSPADSQDEQDDNNRDAGSLVDEQARYSCTEDTGNGLVEIVTPSQPVTGETTDGLYEKLGGSPPQPESKHLETESLADPDSGQPRSSEPEPAERMISNMSEVDFVKTEADSKEDSVLQSKHKGSENESSPPSSDGQLVPLSASVDPSVLQSDGEEEANGEEKGDGGKEASGEEKADVEEKDNGKEVDGEEEADGEDKDDGEEEVDGEDRDDDEKKTDAAEKDDNEKEADGEDKDDDEKEADGEGKDVTPPPVATSQQPMHADKEDVGVNDKEDPCDQRADGIDSDDQLLRTLGSNPVQPPAISAVKKELEDLRCELDQTRHVLSVREAKLLELSQMNVNLSEENDTLRSELAFAPPSRQTQEEGSVEELKEEFTRRIASVEKKLHASLKEKESLRKEIHTLKSAKDSIGSKDDEIASLMAEGEKLSKQQLHNSDTIKKLRKKEQENSKHLTSLRKNLQTAEQEITNLKEALQWKEDGEKKLQENLIKLNTFAEQQAFELSSVKSERDELNDKGRSLQTNLDSVYREMAELKKANAASENAVKEATLSAELSAKEELKSLLEQSKRDHQQQKDMLFLQIADLRAGMSRAEQQASWREDQLRQELEALQHRLQEGELRNEELSSSVSLATKPLLRQLENIQSVHSTQQANWQRVEANLIDRLNAAQTQLSEAQEKERTATEKEAAFRNRVVSLEAQVKGLRSEKRKMAAELEAGTAELVATEEGLDKLTMKLDSLKSSSTVAIEQLRKGKEAVEHLLDSERAKFEAELRKAVIEAKECVTSNTGLESVDAGMRRPSAGSELRPASTSRSLSVENSGGSYLESSLVRTPSLSATAPAIEHFQSQLRQREGELNNARNLISSFEKSRSSLMEEVTRLTEEISFLTKQVNSIPDTEAKMQDLEKRYDALLQMYGEKSEEAEELRLDLQDVKEMYKQQIQDLVAKRS